MRIVRSRDPNDKVAPAGYGSAAWLSENGALSYIIRFENEADATAPAQKIVITDTLDPNLDLSTFALSEIAFGQELIGVPPGFNHYEDLMPLTFTNPISGTLCQSCLWADVEAALDFTTRTLTVTLSAVDPATGWFPEDPFLGLLYPDDATGQGQGYISYTIRPRAGLPSGTVITNRAQIIFDYNDPIDTPQVRNTIDSGKPSSSVAALPTVAGSTFLVHWSGTDDPGGVGVMEYDVYVSTDGTNYFPWLLGTDATSAYFRGVPGETYRFYTLARDWVGNEEAAPASAQAQVIVPTNAPLLSVVSNVTLNVGQPLAVTNVLLNGTPLGSYAFSLGLTAPSGATINATNGIFRWTPNCSEASRTYSITMKVTDTGNTNIYDLATFTVRVGECVVPGLGRVVLPTGTSGRVPVNLISSVPLTNLSMTVETDTNRLRNFWLEPIVPEICSSALTPALSHPMGEGGAGGALGTNGNNGANPPNAAAGIPSPGGEGQGEGGLYRLSLATCPNQFLIGTQQVAWLNFTAATSQSSAFVSLKLDNGVGLQPDGSEVRNFAPQAGRTVVVGNEPLLEAVLASNRQPALILYGQPGPDYFIEGKPRLDASLPWQTVWQGTQSNLFQQIQPIGGTNRMMFFRARRGAVAGPQLEARLGTNQQVVLTLHGEAGAQYIIQSRMRLDGPEIWQPAWTGTLSSAQQEIPLALTTNRTLFFSPVRP